MVGATPLEDIGCFIALSAEMTLISRNNANSVFLYQYITLLASLIYFWRGVSRPQRPPLDPPLLMVDVFIRSVIKHIVLSEM